MTDIPEGHGIIAGRSRVNAQAALDAAKAAGVDPTQVRAVKEGYLVPDAVLEAFHAAASAEPADTDPGEVPAGDPTPTSDWKNAEIETWASDHGIDLGGATKKADMLAAIHDATKKEE